MTDKKKEKSPDSSDKDFKILKIFKFIRQGLKKAKSKKK